MADAESVRVTIDDHIATIVIDRRPGNVLDVPCCRDLIAAIDRLNDLPDEVRVMVLTGSDPVFATDDDARSAAPPTTLAAAIGAVYHAEIPVIAAVNGAAFGAGFRLAAVCDILVASDRALFAMSDLDDGRHPGVGTLLRGFNQYQVREMAFTGRRYDAAEMQRRGLLRTIVAHDQLAAEARSLAAVLAAKAPGVLRAAKWSANQVELMFSNFEASYRAIETRP